jgi:hypothetical protein
MRNKRKIWKLLPLARAIGVLSAVGIATTLVTFAAIQSTGNALTGNTIQTATASLQISRNDVTYSDNVQGFNFTGLIPGGAAQPTDNSDIVYVKNVGTATLGLSLAVPTEPTVTGIVDLSKVSVILTGTGTPQTFQLSSLIAGNIAIANSSLVVGGKAVYHVQVSMTGDAVTGNGATISNLNLSFSGSPQ